MSTVLRVGRTVYWQRPPGPRDWPVEGIGRIAHNDDRAGIITLTDGTLLLATEAVALLPCGTELGKRRHRRRSEYPCNTCRGRVQTRASRRKAAA